MTQTCTKCGKIKPVSDFHFRRDNQKYRGQCKVCWAIRCSATRLGITFDQVAQMYQATACDCCGLEFVGRKCIHHTNTGVHGTLCHYCNIALRQEQPEDLWRIRCCLDYMSSERENLANRDNQQERPSISNSESPTTTRPASQRECKRCKAVLPLSEFFRQKYQSGKTGYYAACKHCYKILQKVYQYGLTFEQVECIRSSRRCDCCGVECDVFVHHVGDRVYGGVCRVCNLLLEQESDVTRHRLESCYQWLITR